MYNSSIKTVIIHSFLKLPLFLYPPYTSHAIRTIFSVTYLNSSAECCIREIEARKNVDHLAIETHNSVLKSSAHTVSLATSFYNICLLLKCCRCTLQCHLVLILEIGTSNKQQILKYPPQAFIPYCLEKFKSVVS